MFKRKQADVTLDVYAPKKSHKFKQWVKQNKPLAIILLVVGVLIVSAGVVAAVNLLAPKPAEPTAVITQPKPEPEPEPVIYYSPLTGVEVKDEAATKQPVTAVMIENSPSARPQSGLKESGVVFEAIAEGGITRFLVLYQEDKPKLIGPVRSLRIYYLDWLTPFNASVAHVGGSYDALRAVRNGNHRDIDQFFNASSYWRSTDRYAPHNVYTNFSRLDALNKKKGYTSSIFTGFTRKDSSASEKPSATTINIPISSPNYNTAYKYNAKTNTYDRMQAGKAHIDREKGQISPRVVIAMHVKGTPAKAVGSGTAYIFQDGTVQEVTWKKSKKTAQITFTDKKGKDVPLARGQTWIAAVPSGKAVTWR